MELWYPKAKRDLFQSAGRFTLDMPWRGVLHTMEGSYAGSRVIYSRSGVAPQFSVELGQVYQHMPLDEAGRALVNLAGGVQTNLARAVQIEVAGYATRPWPTATITATRDLMIWIEAQTGIVPEAPLAFKPYPSSYGAANGVRMAPAQWNAFNAWCGHMHCPENLHGDPGAAPIDQLLIRPPKELRPMYDPPLGPIAAVWQEEGTGKVFAAISPDGAVYAWANGPGNSRAWYGNTAGKPYWGTRKVALIGARDDGQEGYMITATDKAVYRLPDGLDSL